MKRIIKDYLTFSKKERIAVIILLLLIAFFIAMPYFYSPKFTAPVVNKALTDYLSRSKTETVSDDSIPRNMDYAHSSESAVEVSKRETFFFDPNTIEEKDWKRLGIADKTIRTIINYRNKGGQFRTAEDLRKIWGFKKEDADRLIPFIQIEKNNTDYPTKKSTPNPQPVTRNKITELDINTATPEDWKALPGIGEVLANRIIKFRERIGGFTTIEQVQKTYGISDSVFQLIRPYLTISAATVPGLNLNKASISDLRMVTSIPEPIARAIVVYRQQYGPYQSVADLKKIVFIPDSLYQRIAPYLVVK